MTDMRACLNEQRALRVDGVTTIALAKEHFFIFFQAQEHSRTFDGSRQKNIRWPRHKNIRWPRQKTMHMEPL